MIMPKLQPCAGALFVIAAAVLAASASSAQAEGQTWKHAIIDPKSDAGFQVMAVRGAFAYKQGIDIQFPHMQNDVIMLRALLAGELDSYEGGAATAILAGSRNADVKIVGCQWQTVVHSVFARAELKSPAEMKGATMAISAPNATPDMVGKAWLRQNNVSLDDVKFASLGNDPDRFKALLGKVAMATVISIEFLPIAEKQGIKLMARGSEVLPKYLRLCTVTTGKTLQARREDAIRFLTAQMQGLQHALANKAEEIKVTREITGAKADDPRPEFIFNEAANPKTGVDPTMPIDMDKLNWLQEQLVSAGNLKQSYDLSRIVDTDIREAALKRARLQR
jgi:NitT/TauT family transport system substrate-binding protein